MTGEFCWELDVAADEALMADAGRDEADRTIEGKEVWTWLGIERAPCQQVARLNLW
jgi:hypothetical protein